MKILVAVASRHGSTHELGIGERLIARAVGAPDGDFRDWAALNIWADEIAAAVPTTRAPADANDITAEPLSALRRVD